jgi:membrane-bound lytic murein transglycosylase B
MKLIKLILAILVLSISNSYSDNQLEFLKWKEKFKTIAISNNISERTFDKVMANVKFLPKVIEYDRFQPEFYEDTKTYINKRVTKKKSSKGVKLF